jgi:outer membrane receptor protein involved in Fe transport
MVVSPGTLEIGVDGTKIFKLTSQFTPAARVLDLVSTPYNPNDLRLRARGSLTVHDLTVSVFVNYVDSYIDNRGVSPVPVSSWTTADATISYRAPKNSGLLRGFALSAGVLNLADRNPPFVRSNPQFTRNNINFDGANASALGRVGYLQLSKQW